jgi:hypothetical protein
LDKDYPMKMFRFSLALAALLAIALPVSAQEVGVLQNINGNVLVSNTSGGFDTAVSGQSLAEGQSITVGAGGSATVSTAAGNVTLSAGTYTVGPGGVIANGAGTVMSSSAGGGAGGVGGGVGGGLGTGAGGALGTLGVIGGVAAGVGAGLESSTIEEDNKTPVEPISH